MLSTLARPFAYGAHDCCLWVADAVLEETGVDIAAFFRGRYTSRTEASALLKEFAGTASLLPVMRRVAHQHALKQVPMAFAHRGDIALVSRARDYSLGLIGLDGRTILAAAETGLLRLPLEKGYATWRV